ncbi:hypothetical protein HPB50_016322 [Hyalomma asiaticum]|uniref:Uncharacterized protein n=1 Tax=Hyalomma asiaticum TaxID=266040 RepID=A0ACB7RV17_HYAAI|nr:hypothetical protein HPB50_016322 [Hyalomma asiaticum]
MSAKDLDALCTVLSGTSIETLQSLKEFDIWWLPPMAGSTRDEAVKSIRVALEAFDSCKYRVRCMAGLYCCLAQRQVLHPWSCLVVVGTKDPMTREFTLHDSLASLWQRLRGYAVSVKVEWGDTIYACVMGKDEGCESLEHEVICVAVYRTRSLVYVYARRHVLFAVHCVHFVLRGPFKPAGYSGELRHAFASAPDNQEEASTEDPEKYGSLLDAYRVRRNPEKATNTQRTMASSLSEHRCVNGIPVAASVFHESSYSVSTLECWEFCVAYPSCEDRCTHVLLSCLFDPARRSETTAHPTGRAELEDEDFDEADNICDFGFY